MSKIPHGVGDLGLRFEPTIGPVALSGKPAKFSPSQSEASID
ncbi:MAG: hypothetical protein JWM11_4607 [Planctomycetaceae bacterium]|nr:hypothetical protein [Planctomycetaceae bacterium]